MSVIAIGISLANIGVAQPMDNPPQFDKLDANKDGQIGIYEAEADTRLLAQFGQLDTNGDGQLSRDEYAALKAEEK